MPLYLTPHFRRRDPLVPALPLLAHELDDDEDEDDLDGDDRHRPFGHKGRYGVSAPH